MTICPVCAKILDGPASVKPHIGMGCGGREARLEEIPLETPDPFEHLAPQTRRAIQRALEAPAAVRQPWKDRYR